MSERVSYMEAIDRLNAIAPSGVVADPEAMHVEADEIVLSSVPEQVREAYQRVKDRCSWWASA